MRADDHLWRAPIGLLALTGGWSLIAWWAAAGETLHAAWLGGAVVPSVMRSGDQLWRLAAAPLVHVDPGHFVLNAMTILVAARAWAGLVGGRAVLAVFWVGGALGAVASVASDETWSLGASGGALALVAATAVRAIVRRRTLTRGQATWAWVGTAPWLLGLVFVSVGEGPTDHAAHAAGLAFGVLAGAGWRPWRGAPWVAAGLAIWALAGAIHNARRALPTTTSPPGWTGVEVGAPCDTAHTDGFLTVCRVRDGRPAPKIISALGGRLEVRWIGRWQLIHTPTAWLFVRGGEVHAALMGPPGARFSAALARLARTL